MKRQRSLKSELLYDLSLLTFCALILSSGLLLILLRLNIPESLNRLSKDQLVQTHRAFTSENSTTDLSSNKIEKKFNEYLSSESNKGLSRLSLNVRKGSLKQSVQKTEHRHVMGIFSTPKAYEWTTPVGKDFIFSYRADFSPLHQVFDKYKFIVFFMSLLLAGILVWIGYHLLFKRNILVPIQNLNITANAFQEGDFSKRYEIVRRDELGQIGEALNEMGRKIVEKEKKLVLTIESLQQANEEIELKKNEQLQIEKLASVGRLAAGVAHEVGNPLGAISGYLDILRRSMEKASDMNKEDLDLLSRIETESNRINRIIRALLQQARPPQDRIRPVQLKPVLERAVELAQIPDTIDVQYEFQTEEAEALCEKDQLLQVVLNLIINAKHAIESKEANEKGQIRIRCRPRKLPQYANQEQTDDDALDSSMIRSLKPQTYWMINIVDNGVGISEEDQKKLFEPFFSTKETGKGTGLGLYVAKSIVESFRGAIVVRSEPGYGTSFSLFLPKDL